MTPRARHLLLALAAVCLVTTTGAFSSTTADRSVSVSVADDEDAYLGIEIDDPVVVERESTGGTNNTTENGTNAADEWSEDMTLLTFTDDFGTSLDVDVSVAESGEPSVDLATGTVSLASGETAAVEATVTCRGDNSRDVTLDVTATGDGVVVDLTRAVEIRCEP
jgi:hypothetical protein